MNYAAIKNCDIANGPGVRVSLFVSGCRHHCPGCFNEVAWDFGYGQPFDKAVRNEIFASCQLIPVRAESTESEEIPGSTSAFPIPLCLHNSLYNFSQPL